MDQTVPDTAPLVGATIEAGFPSVASDHIESSLNLHTYLVTRPASTFFIRVKGDSMIGAGIFPKDLLIVDRSISPKSGHIVIALYMGEFTLKRLIQEKNGIFLKAENPAYPTLSITHPEAFEIWGVVIHAIHSF